MATKTEGVHTLEFLISEANGYRSRENATVTVAGSVALPSGTLLGKVRGTASSAAVAGNTGNGTMGTVTASAGAKQGVYKLTIIEPGANAGEFVVEDPDGNTVGNGTVAVAFSAGGLGFTLADGATDFAAGDQFSITVADGTKYAAYDDDNTNGTEEASAVLITELPGVNGDYPAALIARDAEVFVKFLGGYDAAGAVDLAKRGIIVRS